MTGKGRVYPPLADRFWARVDRAEGHGPNGDCWVWTGSKKTGGYGLIRDGGARLKAHRVSYELAFGPLPVLPGYHGACVLHHCDNPSCVRPDHLYIGDPAANAGDMKRRGRAPEHKGEKNEAAKLTEAQVRRIRQDARPASRIAPDYGVHEVTIWRIKNKVLWPHI